MKRFILSIVTILLIVVIPLKAQVSVETPEQKNERLKWWREAKFGMFIHWGPSSVPAGIYNGKDIPGGAEWIMFSGQIPVDEYEKYVHQFNPTKFNADEWVQTAKNAGMKYIVITSKHHDGFCIWDSKVSEYDIMDATLYKKDVLKELARACKEQGIKLCFYHSILDWHHPDAKGEKFSDYRDNYLKPQLSELLKNYGDIGVLWFDGEWIDEWTEEQGKELYTYLRNIQPNLIINNRVGKGRNGMQGMSADEGYAGDFGTPEQEILEGNSTMDWESCMTMNDSWGFKKNDHNWKSTEELIHNLIDVASKGGNYLLNVGPDAQGLIPEQSKERLKEMGEWLKVNAEVIYETKGIANYIERDYIHYTKSIKSKNIFYASVLKWPGKALSISYVIPEDNAKIYLLGYDKPLKWSNKKDQGTTIEIPEFLQKEDQRPLKYAWCFKIVGSEATVTSSPMVRTSGRTTRRQELFSDTINISISPGSPNDVIFYTLDGSSPGSNANYYNGPIVVDKSMVLKTIALRDNCVNSKQLTVEFIKVDKFNSIILRNDPSQKYTANGVLSLADGIRATTKFTDGQWLGFEGNDFVATIDLGKKKSFKSIRVGFLQHIGTWIFLPEKLTLEISVDGKVYQEIGKLKHQTNKNEMEVYVKDLIFMNKQKHQARYLRIKASNIGTCPEWHGGAGGKAWIFTDEIIVE